MKDVLRMSACLLLLAALPAHADKAQDAVTGGAVRMGASMAAADALCNGRDVAATRASVKTNMRKQAFSDGLPAARFDSIFDQQFESTQRQFKAATPAQRKRNCDQLRAMAATLKKDVGTMQAGRRPKH